MSITFVQNNFIKNLFITKFSERKSDRVRGHTSRPYNSSGKLLLLIIFKVTSSEAVLPIFPKTADRGMGERCKLPSTVRAPDADEDPIECIWWGASIFRSRTPQICVNMLCRTTYWKSCTENVARRAGRNSQDVMSTASNSSLKRPCSSFTV